MNREQKELLVNTLKKDFIDNKASFLVILKGMPVSKIQELRKDLRYKGGKLKVAKNRLVKLAIKDSECSEDLSGLLKDQLGIVFSKDITSAAKILYDFSKSNENFKVIAGCVESRLVGSDSLEFMATLPSREVLLAQLCGTLKSPITRLANVLNMPLTQLLLVLKQASEKKS